MQRRNELKLFTDIVNIDDRINLLKLQANEESKLTIDLAREEVRFKNALKGLRQIFNKDAELYVRKIGGVEFGSKYLELTGFTEKIFRFNLMNKTEGWNRIAAVYAGKMFYADILTSLQGKKGMFAKRNVKRAEQTLKDIYKLDKAQINFLKGYNALTANSASKRLFNSIQIRVDQMSHIATQGGTATALMPLWMSGKLAKPFTLFQRMAYAATWNSYNNYLRPIKAHGNFFPLLRFGAASYLSGASLYFIYDKLLGVEPPKSPSDDALFSNILMNLYRAESLGLFTESLNLFKPSPNETLIQTPVIARHMQNAGQGLIKWWHGDKNWKEASTDFAKQYAVVLGQADKFLQNSKLPYPTNMRRINKLKRVFMNEKDYRMGGFIETSNQEQMPYYRKFKADFAAGEDAMVRSYFAAYNFLVTDMLQQAHNPNPTPNQIKSIHKEAKKRLRSVITKMNPISLSRLTEERGREKSVAREFEEWLSPDKLKMYKKLQSEYGYKVRLLNKLVAKNYKRSSVFPFLYKF